MHELYIQRCFDLAKLAGKDVKSNPQVGAVIVYNNIIIGEGYHKEYGGNHAEVEAFNSIKKHHLKYLQDAYLYISLEPCCIDSKTPPCTKLILNSGIKNVIIATLDPNPLIAGKGLRILNDAGIKTTVGVLENRAKELIQAFICNLEKRPMVTLKWAKSKNNYIGNGETQVWLSNNYTSIFSHKLRSLNDAILIGTNTAIIDNPRLNNRKFSGENPLRVIIDRTLKIPRSHHIYSDDNPSLIITEKEPITMGKNKFFLKLNFQNEHFISQLLENLFERGVYRLLVEGGAKIHTSFIKSNQWNQAFIIQTNNTLNQGIKAPNLKGKLTNKWELDVDTINQITNSRYLS